MVGCGKSLEVGKITLPFIDLLCFLFTYVYFLENFERAAREVGACIFLPFLDLAACITEPATQPHKECPDKRQRKAPTMNVESLIGKFSITSRNDDPNALTIVSESHATLVSVLDGVELMAGSIGEDQSFTDADIESFSLFGKPHFRITISRAQLLRFFEYEILNFLDYTSLTQMRNYSK